MPLVSKLFVLQTTLSVAQPKHISQGKNLIRDHSGRANMMQFFSVHVLDAKAAAQS